MEIDPVFLRTSQGAVAIVFGAAAIAKLLDLERFEQALASYDLVPSVLVAPLAMAIAVAELVVALALPIDAARQMAAVTGLALLGVFFSGMSINLVRGNRDIDCGCWAFGKKGDAAARACLAGTWAGPRCWPHCWRQACLSLERAASCGLTISPSQEVSRLPAVCSLLSICCWPMGSQCRN
ncbi:hypothetical protein AWV80_08850 [Cupriavidus sp. UYMU48A]|nr:hypothetical protein AWV80_08850 [Cupriavidus sp. UYMU48A]